MPYLTIERANGALPDQFSEGLTLEDDHIDCEANGIELIFTYKSDTLDNLSPTFKKIEKKMQVMCGGD